MVFYMFYSKFLMQKSAVPLQRISDYVFPEMKLHGLVPNSHIHVFVSDLYIPTISPPIFCCKIGGPIVGRYKSLTET